MVGWFMYTLGPAVVLLRDEFEVSRSVAGLHGTASALGGITAALIVVRLVERIGRRRVLLSAVALAAVGVALLVFGNDIAYSLAGACVCSIAGSFSINVMTAAITLRHGQRGGGVLTQAHAVMASTGLLAPLALGAYVALGWGWRPAFMIVWVFGLAIAIGVIRLPRTDVLDYGATTRLRRPRERRKFQTGYWPLFVVLVVTVGAETATLYWSADLIRTRLSIGAAAAATGTSAFLLGIALGRFVLGRIALTRSFVGILMAMLPFSLLGWLLFWISPNIVVSFAGLFCIGLGISASFPLLVALMSARSADQPDRSIALSGLGAGIASGVSPFALGAVSDVLGPVLGFLLVPVLLLVGLVLLAWQFRVHGHTLNAAA